MHILALDTTSRGGSVAVARGGTVIYAAGGDATVTHGERLPGDLMRAVAAAGITPSDLSLLAVAAGPGSFTGLRVGIAAIQGLAVALGLSVVPVPTLEALAQADGVAEAGGGGPVAAWMDGQRGEVFAAMYDPHPDLVERHAPVAAAPAAVLDLWPRPERGPIVFVGDGAVRYRAAIEARFGDRARVLAAPPLAPAIARIAFAHPLRAVAPHAIVPVYVRRPDAELARDRREGRA